MNIAQEMGFEMQKAAVSGDSNTMKNIDKKYKEKMEACKNLAIEQGLQPEDISKEAVNCQ